MSEETRKEYNKLTREIKRKSKQCKESWIQDKCKEVESSAGNHNSGKLFKTAKEICGNFKSKLPVIKDKVGKKLEDKVQITKR